jgi:hypothetical protein
LNIVIRFTKYLAENWKRTRMCVKILFIGAFVLVLLAPLNYLNLYLHINSGGLTPSGEVCCWTFFGFWGILFCFHFFAVICLILSFSRAPRITNFIFSITGAILIYSIGSMCFGDKVSHFFGQPKEDLLRYYAHNIQAIENLKEFSKQLTKSDFTFTEQSVKDLSDLKSFGNERYHYIFDPDFDFNKNLLGFKPDQINKDTVLLFQSKNDSSPFSGADDISAEWHYGKGSLIVFGDGRIEFVKKESFKNLRWQP